MRAVLTVAMWLSLLLLSGCGGCSGGERDKNKNKDVPKVATE